MADANFDPADIKGRLYHWEEGKSVREDRVMIFRDGHTKSCGNTWRSLFATSLYDALRREARGKEPRLAVAVWEIKAITRGHEL